jgi:hypothetical protein
MSFGTLSKGFGNLQGQLHNPAQSFPTGDLQSMIGGQSNDLSQIFGRQPQLQQLAQALQSGLENNQFQNQSMPSAMPFGLSPLGTPQPQPSGPQMQPLGQQPFFGAMPFGPR